jgi:hypothetical protein
MSLSRRFLCNRVAVAAAVAVACLACAGRAHAVLVAYEGFAYPANSPLVAGGVGLNGGTGWAGAWDNDTMTQDGSTMVLAGSLSYTDKLGNVLTTTGGKLRNFVGAESVINQQGRTLATRRAAGTNTVTWFSMLGIRQGDRDTSATGLAANLYGRGANLSFFDTTQPTGETEKINLGENSSYQFPMVDGNDFLRIQRGEVTSPGTMEEQIALFKSTNGMSGTLAVKAEDRWMAAAPRASGNITALANPAVQVNGTPITSNLQFQRDPSTGRFQRYASQTSFDDLVSFVLVRIDHAADTSGRDKATMWFNPNLNAAPSDSTAQIVLDMAAIEARAQEIITAGGSISPIFGGAEGALFSFDRLRLFAGQATGAQMLADWLIDEIRIGDTFADVTPHTGGVMVSTGVPEPGTLALAGAAVAMLLRRRRR